MPGIPMSRMTTSGSNSAARLQGRRAVVGHLHGVSTSIDSRRPRLVAASTLSSTIRMRRGPSTVSGLLASAATRSGFQRRQGVREDRQPDLELAAPAGSIAVGLDRAAVQFHQFLDQSQANAHSPRAAIG